MTQIRYFLEYLQRIKDLVIAFWKKQTIPMDQNKSSDIKERSFHMETSLPVKKKSILLKSKKGAPFCICTEASFLAESAIVLPLFAGFMLTILFFFQVLIVQQEVGNALVSAARKIAAQECMEEEKPKEGLLRAKASLIKNISKDSAAEQFIRGGRRHILLSGSSLTENYVLLQADYKIMLPFGLFGKREIAVTQRVKCRRWTGSSMAKNEEGEVVFLTPQGNVYHRSRDCSYLKPLVEGVDGGRIAMQRNADGGKYYSCIKCVKNKNKENGVVYITKYGNRYHGDRNCSRIKHTILVVRLSEVQGKKGCSKCGRE